MKEKKIWERWHVLKPSLVYAHTDVPTQTYTQLTWVCVHIHRHIHDLPIGWYHLSLSIVSDQFSPKGLFYFSHLGGCLFRLCLKTWSLKCEHNSGREIWKWFLFFRFHSILWVARSCPQLRGHYKVFFAPGAPTPVTGSVLGLIGQCQRWVCISGLLEDLDIASGVWSATEVTKRLWSPLIPTNAVLASF